MCDGLRKPAEAMAPTAFAKKFDVVVKNDSESESSKNESLKRTSVLATLTGTLLGIERFKWPFGAVGTCLDLSVAVAVQVSVLK